MRVADYIYKELADHGVEYVFMVSGGGAMHLNDALGREKRIQYICNLHEQACAMVAEGYARVTNKPGVLTLTTGPGGTNALTGVMGAWVDSIPMIIISGQVKQSTTICSCPSLGLRQLGDQEFNIIDAVRPMTKYAVMLNDAMSIKYHLQRAIYLAQSGRPGPVWLDIPLDIQATEIDELKMVGFIKEKEQDEQIHISDMVQRVISSFKEAKRPVIIAGNGVRLSGAVTLFRKVVAKLDIPVLTAISGIDLIESDSRSFFGRPGILGDRAANFIMQNADLVFIIGTRMNLRVIGYAYDKFARKAFKIGVDIDNAELHKPTLKLDMPICCDAGLFLSKLNSALPENIERKAEWVNYCLNMTLKYPIVTAEHRNIKGFVSSYVFAEELSKNLVKDEIIVTGNGTAYTSTFQAIKLKFDNRMFANVACASMGYDLPAAIGAALAAGKRKTICITGDGSVQMNIQELQTIVNYKLPIKIFIFNNDGYLSIKVTQNSFFNGHFVGSERNSGVILPNLEKLANAYGISYISIHNHEELRVVLPQVLNTPDAVICEVMTPPFEELGPKACSKKLSDGTMVSRPLEDMAPLLSREEFLSNMLIEPE